MKPLIVLTDPLFPKILKDELRGRARYRIVPFTKLLARDLSTADALVVLLTDRVDQRILKQAPHLKVLATYSVGVDHIDLKAAHQRKLPIVYTPRILTRSTAELALTLLLAAARRASEGEAICRKNRFKGIKPDFLLGKELKGRHAVLVGQGQIGKETAKLFRAVGLTTEFITRRDSSASIHAKLKRAQVLSLHTPLTPQTRHWLSATRISKLPSDAIVLNTSRGAVIDEKALIRALKRNRIFAAGLDVYENEPQIPRELRALSNVVLLPHLGSATEEARHEMARQLLRGVLAVLQKKRPWNLL